jgi:hypothetical protein
LACSTRLLIQTSLFTTKKSLEIYFSESKKLNFVIQCVRKVRNKFDKIESTYLLSSEKNLEEGVKNCILYFTYVDNFSSPNYDVINIFFSWSVRPSYYVNDEWKKSVLYITIFFEKMTNFIWKIWIIWWVNCDVTGTRSPPLF